MFFEALFLLLMNSHLYQYKMSLFIPGSISCSEIYFSDINIGIPALEGIVFE